MMGPLLIDDALRLECGRPDHDALPATLEVYHALDPQMRGYVNPTTTPPHKGWGSRTHVDPGAGASGLDGSTDNEPSLPSGGGVGSDQRDQVSKLAARRWLTETEAREEASNLELHDLILATEVQRRRLRDHSGWPSVSR